MLIVLYGILAVIFLSLTNAPTEDCICKEELIGEIHQYTWNVASGQDCCSGTALSGYLNVWVPDDGAWTLDTEASGSIDPDDAQKGGGCCQ